MNCPTCGLPWSEGAAGSVCLRCSLRHALDLGDAGQNPANSIEGYELMHELGRGAMGTVWLARERSLDRLVALKLIPTGGDPVLAQRLLREGQAAARLHHPHIVSIHALGGTGPSTFLAMDFLAGGNLAEHLQGRPLEPRNAAALAAKLAGALAHAHQAGILHRDLKPSNVLLDSAGEPHLGDFGLAGPLGGRGDLTQAGQFAGTPAYAAPELLEGADHATERSDVYGLGAVLYFCLTGRAPFEEDSATAILRQVAEAEPPAPRLLRPAIPRDLETICVKCLEKSPARRYGSAQALQDDLSRFLRGETIAARPVGPIGRTLRWCARNPAAAAAAGLAAVILIGLAVGGPMVALRLERSRKSAENAAETANAVTEFLRKDLLEQASPEAQPDRDLRLRAVLDRAAQKVQARFANRPTVEVAIRQTLGETYYSLGDLAPAQSQMEQALALQQSMPGAAAETVETMLVLAQISGDQGNWAKSENLFARTLELSRRSLGEEANLTIKTMDAMSVMLSNEGKLDQGEALGREALALQQRVAGPEDPLTLALLNNVGSYEFRHGRYAEAEAILKRIVPIRRRVLGPDHPDTFGAIGSLAFVYFAEGKLPEAEALDLESVATHKRVLGPDNRYTLYAMSSLVQIYQAEKHLAEAESLQAQIVESCKRAYGPSSADTVKFMAGLGGIYLDEKRFDLAAPMLRDALQGSMRNDATSWRNAVMRSRLGGALAGQQRFAEAEPLLLESYRELLRRKAELPVSTQAEIGTARARLLALYTDWQKPAQAAEWAASAP